MATQRSLLLIADIGGYTRFMSGHRIALGHAQEMVASLLETVIDAARPFHLAKLEGDAAFLYAPVTGAAPSGPPLGSQVAEIRRAFIARQREISANRICSCQGCTEVDNLSLKFVAHVGDVAFQKIKRYTELAGIDVILVHRMLKNDVPEREYVLMTDSALEGLEPALAAGARHLVHDFEGLGATQTHFVDLSGFPADAAPLPRAWPVRVWQLLKLNARALPSFSGVKPACDAFRNVQIEKPPRLLEE